MSYLIAQKVQAELHLRKIQPLKQTKPTNKLSSAFIALTTEEKIQNKKESRQYLRKYKQTKEFVTQGTIF